MLPLKTFTKNFSGVVFKFGLGLLALSSFMILSGCTQNSSEERLDRFAKNLATHLEFNDEQKVLLSQLVKDIKADLPEEKVRRLKAKDEFKAMILSSKLDQNRIKEMIKDRETQWNQNIERYLPKAAALHKTLTEKQKSKIADRIDSIVQQIQ